MKLGTPTRRLAALLLALALAGTACSKKAGATGTVTLLTQTKALLTDVIRPFTEQNPKLKLDATTFLSENDAVAKLQAGSTADVVYACVTDTHRLVTGGLVQPIDTSRLSAWGTLFPYYANADQIRSAGKVYIAPAFGGTTGIITNTQEVPGGVTSFKQLMEDPALAGKVTIEDNPRYGIAMGALALGMTEPYDLSDAQLGQVKDWYLAHRAQVKAFFTSGSQFESLFKTGDVVAGFGYKGSDVGLAKDNVPVAFTRASEGALTWTCGYAIGAHATNLPGAYALLNWFLSPTAQDVYATKYDQMVTNQQSLGPLAPAVRQAIGMGDLTQLDASTPTQVPANYAAWQAAWQAITSA
jgi:spermidine/putrescine transport system substrate-binding protein